MQALDNRAEWSGKHLADPLCRMTADGLLDRTYVCKNLGMDKIRWVWYNEITNIEFGCWMKE